MKTIWKFPLDLVDRQIVEMPKDAKILTAQVQGLVPCLWAIVDTEIIETEMRSIEIVGTGNPMPEVDLMVNTRSYIGTVQQSGFVWHVFEIV